MIVREEMLKSYGFGRYCLKITNVACLVIRDHIDINSWSLEEREAFVKHLISERNERITPEEVTKAPDSLESEKGNNQPYSEDDGISCAEYEMYGINHSGFIIKAVKDYALQYIRK
jgi:hypothetical protein